MFWLLLVALLAVPLVELWIVLAVAANVGIPETIFALVAISIAGAWLVHREGTGVLARIRSEVSMGRVPAGDVVDGLLILVAGALMLTPGFLTDAIGLLLLIPLTRLPLRRLALRRLQVRVQAGPGAGGGFTAGFGMAHDVTRYRERPAPPGGRPDPRDEPPELGQG